MFRKFGNRRGISECLAGLAGLKGAARSARLGCDCARRGQREPCCTTTGGAWWPANRIEVERDHEVLRSELTHDEFQQAWKTGESMTIDQAMAFASSKP